MTRRSETDARQAAREVNASAGRAITQGSIVRAMWRLALPTWGAFVFHNLMGIVDMLFVGRIYDDWRSAVAVAAVSMSAMMFGIIIMLAMGIETGITALVANAFGRDDSEQAGAVAAQGLVLAVFLAIPLAVLGVGFAPAILRLLGVEPDVVKEGTAYLRIISGGGITMLAMIAVSGALRGAGDAMAPCKAMILANVLNLALDPILIFGFLGFPALGVAGSAWATVTSRAIGLLLLVGSLRFSRRSALRLHVRDLKPRFGVMARIGRIGAFASGGVLLRNIGMLALMRLTATFGTAAVAAFGICFRLQMVILGPGRGFGTAAATLVGQNLGARRIRRATRSGWMAAGAAMAIGVVLAALFWADPRLLIRLFNEEPEVVDTGVSLLHWFSASFPFLALGVVLGQAMNGAGDSLRPMVITGVANLLIALPLGAALALRWDSAQGIWVALFASNVVLGLLSAVVFYRGAWRAAGLRRTEHAAPPPPPEPDPAKTEASHA